MRGARVAAIVLVAAAGLTACSSDDGSQSTDETTTRGTDASTSSSSPSTTEATTSVTVGIICSAPQDAASALVSAWTAGDRDAAKRCASDSVVDRLFQGSGAGNTWMDQGCDATEPTAPVCAYSYEGGAAFLTATGSDADGWKITKLRFQAD
jgi:hypothetical protein